MLNDGTSAYVYGLDLVSQQTGIYEEYPLRDALGSVRQVTDQSSAITGSRNYEPYGSVLSFSGEESTAYGFAGEWTDASGMQYLRARFYDPAVGRFVSRDSWGGDINQPISYNKWVYGYANPIMYSDPTGLISCYGSEDEGCEAAVSRLYNKANEIHNRMLVTSIDPDNNLPVEAFAQLTDLAYELFGHDNRGIMWGLTKVLVGIDPNDYHYVTLQPAQDLLKPYYDNQKIPPDKDHEGEFFAGQRWLPYTRHDGEDKSEIGDWNPKYFDGTANQAFHFMYFASGRYFDGIALGTILTYGANMFHDPVLLEADWLCGDNFENVFDKNYKVSQIPFLVQWAKRVGASSQEDSALSVKGIEFGAYMQFHKPLPMSPGNWIRTQLK